LLGLEAVLIVVGVSIEGVRLAIIPMILSFMVSATYYQTEILGDFATIQLGTLITLILRYFFGEANFDKFKTTGPYDVGFTEVNTKEYGNSCSIFYPIDKLPGRAKKGIAWQRYGNTQHEALLKISAYRKHPPGSFLLLKPLKSVIVPVYERADVAKEFKLGLKPL
jgi:hypothetical protein